MLISALSLTIQGDRTPMRFSGNSPQSRLAGSLNYKLPELTLSKLIPGIQSLIGGGASTTLEPLDSAALTTPAASMLSMIVAARL